jgi:nucleoside-diphosphate-sugar epimerase
MLQERKPAVREVGGAAMHDETGRSIILTGATGFLGAFLMAGLLERGYSVTVLGRSSKNMSLTERI